MLSVNNFLGMKSTANMTPLDCLVEVAWLKSKYGEEDDLIAEKFRIKKQETITQSPQAVDHQEKPILDFVIPRKKRTMGRQVTQQSFSNGIKKDVENNSEDQQHRVIKIYRDVGASNQEFFRLRNRSDDRKNRVIRKRSASDPLLGFNNQERKKMNRGIAVRELDIEFKNLITSNGGSLESLKLVIQKTLFQTDVKPAEGRLSIPQKKMSNSFLEPEEDAHLDNRNGSKMNEMKVMLIEPLRRVSEINLRKWSMNNSLSYVLVTYWNKVVRRNDLEAATKVQLWAFRQVTNDHLGFALVKLQD